MGSLANTRHCLVGISVIAYKHSQDVHWNLQTLQTLSHLLIVTSVAAYGQSSLFDLKSLDTIELAQCWVLLMPSRKKMLCQTWPVKQPLPLLYIFSFWAVFDIVLCALLHPCKQNNCLRHAACCVVHRTRPAQQRWTKEKPSFGLNLYQDQNCNMLVLHHCVTPAWGVNLHGCILQRHKPAFSLSCMRSASICWVWSMYSVKGQMDNEHALIRLCTYCRYLQLVPPTSS